MEKNKKITLIAVAIILFLAIFVRTYHFQDWLYFKMDQARDALLISKAIDGGIGNLPLLGPRAGATDIGGGFLRLGPAYYYFQYLSGKIFNSTSPETFAYPDLFFSLAAIILIYFFLRLYFDRLVSVLLLALYSFSFIIIQYSRFAWNPNALQFFAILSFFGLLKFFQEESEKRKKWWLTLWAIGLFVGSQLHFFGFFMLLGVSGLFILIKFQPWKKESFLQFKEKFFWKKISHYLAIVCAVFVFVYAPVIVSDVVRKGNNTKSFFLAMQSKPQNSEKTFDQKLQRAIEENVKNYCLITTSYCHEGKYKKMGFPRDFTKFMLLIGIALIGWNLKNTADPKKKDFLGLVLIWMGVFFVLTIPVSYDIRPRFFIPVFLIPYIIIGMFFELFRAKARMAGSVAVIALASALLFVNAQGTSEWFSEQESAQKEDISSSRTLILKNRDGVTLGQLQGAVDYIYENKKDGAVVYYYIKPEHVAPLKYLFSQKKDARFEFKNFKIPKDPSGQYFAVIPSDKNLEYLREKISNELSVKSMKAFGQLTVYEISLPNIVVPLPSLLPVEIIVPSVNLNERVFWRDVFGDSSEEVSPEEVVEENSEDIIIEDEQSDEQN